MRLLVEGIDPAVALVEKAVMSWVCGLWDGLVEFRVMQEAWRAECAARAGQRKVSGSRIGGAAALFDALETLGWTAPAADVLKARDGTMLCFGHRREAVGGHAVAPALIKSMLKDDMEQALLVDSQLAREFEDIKGVQGYARNPVVREERVEAIEAGEAGEAMSSDTVRAIGLWRRGKFKHLGGKVLPWIWPVARMVRIAKKKGWEKAAGSLRSLAEGGWPMQHKLWVEGKAAHNLCKCREAAGTLWHKLARCRLSKEHRDACCTEQVQKEWAASPWNPMLARGVPARPKDPPLVPEHTWHEACSVEEEKTATGRVYTDGSARGSFWKVRRAGWAFVVLGEDGRWRWTAKGTVDGPDASSFRAELKALLEVLRVAVPPIRIFVDNKGVVDGVKKGEKWCTHSKSACADLWRKVWFLLNELEGQEVHVLKIKAHTTWWDVICGAIPYVDHLGNTMADKAAKEGMAAAESLAPTTAFRRQLQAALTWLKWVLMYTFEWVGDVEAEGAQEEGRGVSGQVVGASGGSLPRFDKLQHELWKVRDELACRRCGRTWRGEEEGLEERVRKQECRGCAAGKAATHATGNINYLWTVHARSKEALHSEGGKVVHAVGPPVWMVDRCRLEETADSEAQQEENRRAAGVEEGVMPWMRVPQWMPAELATQREVAPGFDAEGAVDSGWSRNPGQARAAAGRSRNDHVLVVRGALAYCARCAQFAIKRLGRGLKGTCVAPQNRTRNAVQARLNRLKEGKHPVTGQPIDLS